MNNLVLVNSFREGFEALFLDVLVIAHPWHAEPRHRHGGEFLPLTVSRVHFTALRYLRCRPTRRKKVQTVRRTGASNKATQSLLVFCRWFSVSVPNFSTERSFTFEVALTGFRSDVLRKKKKTFKNTVIALLWCLSEDQNVHKYQRKAQTRRIKAPL